MLPKFIIIGAMKCGTTSLYQYLSYHPEIAVSSCKEPSYFCHAYDRPLSWYESLFSEHRGAVAGEASTHYAKYPIHKNVPKRIHDLLPSVKLIYLVRDPVERILSQYVHNRSHGEESRPIAECLDLDKENPYIAYSRYAMQIKQYRPYFDDEQILVVEAENLKHRREATLNHVLEFLGVRVNLLSAERMNQEANQSAGATERTGISSSLARLSWLHRAYASVPSSIRELLHPLYRSSVDKPNLTVGMRARLYDYFHPEVRWVRQYTGKPFDHWDI